MSALRVVLASWPDEDELVAEIWSGDDYVGDVRRCGTGLRLTVTPSQESSGLDLDEFLEVLAAARRHFVSNGLIEGG